MIYVGALGIGLLILLMMGIGLIVVVVNNQKAREEQRAAQRDNGLREAKDRLYWIEWANIYDNASDGAERANLFEGMGTANPPENSRAHEIWNAVCGSPNIWE